MLQYGQYVAQQLRNASMAIKGYGITKRVAEVNADDSVGPTVRMAMVPMPPGTTVPTAGRSGLMPPTAGRPDV